MVAKFRIETVSNSTKIPPGLNYLIMQQFTLHIY